MTAPAPAPTHPGPGPKPSGPTHPTPTGPPTRALAAIDELLIAALAELTQIEAAADADAVTVELVCVEERLRFFLRKSRRVLAELATAHGADLPVRHHVPLAAVGDGGPGSTTRPFPGEEPTPGSAVALAGAARISDGAVVAPVAGAIHWRCGTAHDRALPCPPEMPGTSELAARVAAFRLPREVRPLVESLNRRAD